MRKLQDMLDREVERPDHEWLDTMQRLTITERTEKRPVAIRSRDVELDCRSIVNQLVSSIPKDFPLRTLYVERQQGTGIQTVQEVSVNLKSCVIRRFQFTDAREEYEPTSECSSGDETLSGDSNMSGLAMMICPGCPLKKRRRDKVLSVESRNIKSKRKSR